MGPGKDRWDEVKIGAGAVPVKIEQGWLEIYHGVDLSNVYSLGAVLLDGREPWKVTNGRTDSRTTGGLRMQRLFRECCL